MTFVPTIHERLCDRARRWLHGSRRCNPVYSNCASCLEIPDAIGWSSAYGWPGSTVIECKASLADFRAEKYKYFFWKKGRAEYPRDRFPEKEALEMGFALVEHARMGDFRFYMCLPGVIPLALIEERAPDHGLIYMTSSRGLTIVKAAPRREYSKVDKDSEIRYLRFAIINRKQPYESSAWPISESARVEQSLLPLREADQ